MKKVSRSQPEDVPRATDTYTPFTDMVSDPDGALAKWLNSIIIEPISALEWHCSPQFEHTNRILPNALWSYIVSGKGQGWIADDRKPFKINPGNIIFYPQNTPYGIYPAKGISFRIINVHFCARIYGSIDLLGMLGLSGCFTANGQNLFQEASNRMAREFALKTTGWTQAMSSLIMQVILHVIRHYGSRLSCSGSLREQEQLRRLAPFFNLIEERLADSSLTVTELARTIFTSEVSLRKILHKTCGVSPIHFLQQKRIESACRLLISSDLNIKEIAIQCGFNDMPYFYRVFHHYMKLTPLDYRKKINYGGNY
ncbi:AraC family transcriptional regulator [Verrucomicrobiota bacterium]